MMKRIYLLLLSSFLVLNVSAGKLKRAFEALEIYNYFKAKELFEKRLKKQECESSYGLSIIYGRNDNPFYNLDSAFQKVLLAESSWDSLSKKSKEKAKEFNIDSTRIQEWKDSIDLKVFLKIRSKPSINKLISYIDEHNDALQVEQAAVLRNQLAFEEAKAINSVLSYRTFLINYPNAVQFSEAQALAYLREFDELTKKGELKDYEQFVNHYSLNPYREQAEDSIYKLMTIQPEIENYHNFIKKHPRNRNVDKAWRAIYSQYTSDYSSERLIEFRLDFPNYPFINDLLVDIALSKEHFFPVMRKGLWGFQDQTGAVRINLEYDFVDEFSEGYALVSKGGKWGYINKNGDVVISFIYDEVEAYQNGLAKVALGENWGFIDRKGEVRVPIIYEDLGDFNFDLALALENGSSYYVYINTWGELVLDNEFDLAYSFSKELALVQSNGKFGFINTRGEEVVKIQYDLLRPMNEYGLAQFKKDTLLGFVNRNNEKVISSNYSQVGKFADSLVMVQKGNKYGYLNVNGELKFPIDFEMEIGAFHWGKFRNGYANFQRKGRKELLMPMVRRSSQLFLRT